jgi:hypothetical protein
MSTGHALAELERHSGAQFDPDLVRVALAAAPQLEAARIELADRKKQEYFSS